MWCIRQSWNYVQKLDELLWGCKTFFSRRIGCQISPPTLQNRERESTTAVVNHVCLTRKWMFWWEEYWDSQTFETNSDREDDAKCEVIRKAMDGNGCCAVRTARRHNVPILACQINLLNMDFHLQIQYLPQSCILIQHTLANILFVDVRRWRVCQFVHDAWCVV